MSVDGTMMNGSTERMHFQPPVRIVRVPLGSSPEFPLGASLAAAVMVAALTLGCAKGADTQATAERAADAASARQDAAADSRAADEVALRSNLANWNAALAGRNAAALAALYAPRVDLYGVEITREAAVNTKMLALAKAPDFTQSVGPAAFDWTDAATPAARFEKKWSQHGKTGSVEALLRWKKEGGAWLVAAETDAPSMRAAARRKKAGAGAAATADPCEQALLALVASTAEAKQLLAGPTNPSAGHVTNGLEVGALGEGTEELPAMTFRVVEYHPTHNATLGWFEVDFAKHEVRELDATMTEGKQIKADKQRLRAAVKACPAKFWD